jgi:TolA-binding protein
MSGTMKQSTQLLTAALAASLSMGAAVANPLNFGGNSKPTSTQVVKASTPELDAASQKCDQLHGKLEQAKKQLEASKANLKAAEAELKAARADKEALGLRTEARELASVAAIDPIISTSASAAPTTNGLGAVSVDAPTVHQIDSNGINTTPLPGGNGGSMPTLQDLAPSNVP